MKPIYSFNIAPSLPKNLDKLYEIAYNLWWSWHYEARKLFMRIDERLWSEVHYNPVELLGKVSQKKLQALADDDGFVAHMNRVYDRLQEYLSEKTWFQTRFGKFDKPFIAYFSAEFGITECVPNYSGGLGVLAGDHSKSASDLGVPFVGIGLLYQQGYFRQYLNTEGWQGELYPTNDFYNMPIRLQKNGDKTPLIVEVEFPGRIVKAQVWKLMLGRNVLYMLDTNISDNADEDRLITGELYGGDLEMRIRQEMILGIGGYRTLRLLDLEPLICHMNEGHSAFMAIERIHSYMSKHKIGFEEALEITRAGNVFTTHTPVPAGIDIFSPDMVKKYFGDYLSKTNISMDNVLGLGRRNPGDKDEPFSTAVAAIHLSKYRNGVSKLHGKVARKMWKDIWAGVPEDEIPIDSVTNGVHHKTWVSLDMEWLFDRYLGPDWVSTGDEDVWQNIDQIPGEELWLTHERRRERLVVYARKRLKKQLKHRGESDFEAHFADEVLNSEALTIGFARRFASYKRAALLFMDVERLKAILCSKERPVQLIFAGKAHPKDDIGKQIIKEIIQVSKQEELRSHIVFIEDYDMAVAKYMVSGVDLWMNTPRRPLEASGTSGMKASVNGALNVSVLDGWWDEAFDPEIGWSIGRGEEYDDPNYQDKVEANALYELLEKEIVPLFYERKKDGVPTYWIGKMKKSMKVICPVFNTNRMVKEYAETFYMPALNRYNTLKENKMQKARELGQYKEKIRKAWDKIRVENIELGKSEELRVGDRLDIKIEVGLGDLSPDEVSVEIYHGVVNSKDAIVRGHSVATKYEKVNGGNRYLFSGSIESDASGRYGFTARILPRHTHLENPFELGLIKWAD